MKLLDVARNFAINNFSELVAHCNFCQLPIEELEEIVQQNSLNVESEEEVYEAVMKWIKGS